MLFEFLKHKSFLLILRRLADFIPRDQTFEIIKIIETNLKIHDERINQIIKILKELKINSNAPSSVVNFNIKKKLTKVIDLANSSVDENEADSYKVLLDKNEQVKIEKKLNKLSLTDSMSLHNEEDDLKNKKIKEFQECQNRSRIFYNKLYDVLNKRQVIPKQSKPIFNLELSSKNFAETKLDNVKPMNSFNLGNNKNSLTEAEVNKLKNNKEASQPLLVTSPISNGKDKLKSTTQQLSFVSSTPANETKLGFGQGLTVQQPPNAQKSLFNGNINNNKLLNAFPVADLAASNLDSNKATVTAPAKTISFGNSKAPDAQKQTSAAENVLNNSINKPSKVLSETPLDVQKPISSGTTFFGSSLDNNGIKLMTGGESVSDLSKATGGSIFGGFGLNNGGNKPSTAGSESLFGGSNTSKPTVQFSFNLPVSTSQSNQVVDKPSTDKTAPKSNETLNNKPLFEQQQVNLIKKPDAEEIKSTSTPETNIFGLNTQKPSLNTPLFSFSFGSTANASNNTNQQIQTSNSIFGNLQKPSEANLNSIHKVDSNESVIQAVNKQITTTNKTEVNKIEPATAQPVVTASNETQISKLSTVSTEKDSTLPSLASTSSTLSANNNPGPISNQESSKTLSGILSQNTALSTNSPFGNMASSNEPQKAFSFTFNAQNSSTKAEKNVLFGKDTTAPPVTTPSISTEAKPITSNLAVTTTVASTVSNPISTVTSSPSIFNLSQPNQNQKQQESQPLQQSLFGTNKKETNSLLNLKPTPAETVKPQEISFLQQPQQNSFLNMKPTEVVPSAGAFSNVDKLVVPVTQNQGPSDVSMESNQQNEMPGLFGNSLGFSSAKPINNENKNPFGVSNQNTNISAGGGLFGESAQKSGFGGSPQANATGSGGIIKGPTFTFSSQNSFGQAPTSPFGATNTQTQQGGNLFSSFTSSPQKTATGGSAFGAAPTFGSTFGSSVFGANSTFGSATSPSGFGSATQAPLFGSNTGSSGATTFFGASSSTSTNLFGALTSTNTNTNLFGASNNKNNSSELSFSQLAQQQSQPLAPQPQANLFSNFTNNQPGASTFGSPNNNRYDH